MKSYWSDDIQKRLSIRLLTKSAKQRLGNKARQNLPPGMERWPFGMPTSVNPFVLLLGISPGALKKGGTRADLERGDYLPSIGEPHRHFDVEDSWKNPHWQKVRRLCHAICRRQDKSLVMESSIAVSGHLNLGMGQAGNGSDKKAINRKIVKWIPEVVTGFLKPEVMVLMGLNCHMEGLAKQWSGSNLQFVAEEPEEVPFQFPTKKQYCFRLWRNPSTEGRPRIVIALPNHPTRHPFNLSGAWGRLCTQLSRIVSKELNGADGDQS